MSAGTVGLVSGEVATTAAVLAAFFGVACVKGVTGLGFSTLCLPLLVPLIGLKAALPLVIIPSVTSNLLVVRSAGAMGETLRRFWPLFAAAPPGIVLGLSVLDAIDQARAAAVLGLVLMAYAGLGLGGGATGRLSAGAERALALPVGLATGFVNGLTGSQVMPVLPYLMALRLPPDRFVQAINVSFTLSSLVMATGLFRLGLMTLDIALLAVIGLGPVWLGVAAGARLRRRLSNTAFRRAVLFLLLMAGVWLIARNFFL